MTTEPGSDELIESAYAAYADPLLRWLTGSTRDRSAAEDITQEAFVRLVIEVRSGRMPDETGAWLFRVAQNLATSRGRRLAVARRRSGELDTPGSAPSPELLTIESESHGSLRMALSELAETDRQVLILAAQGYRGREIARSIGRTDAATRTLLCRARTKVRGRMIRAGAD